LATERLNLLSVKKFLILQIKGIANNWFKFALETLPENFPIRPFAAYEPGNQYICIDNDFDRHVVMIAYMNTIVEIS
jgi:hypothetical protein